MFTAALFEEAKKEEKKKKLWKQPTCQSWEEVLDKWSYVEYYIAIKLVRTISKWRDIHEIIDEKSNMYRNIWSLF